MITRSNNRFNLPGPIVRAILNDPYDAGDADISTTRLINPPQIETLRVRHKDEIHEDVSERIWSMLGQAAHVIAERSAGVKDIAERRYFVDVLGWKVSGAVDLIEGSTLIDYKVTSVWTFLYKSRIPEWTAQGNINRWLAHQNGETHIEKLENILILRDWSQRECKENGKYPRVQVVSQPLELWPLEVAERYVYERVQLHQAARGTKSDGELAPCTDEETWLRNGKRARCESYCAVKNFCSQYKAGQDAKRNIGAA